MSIEHYIERGIDIVTAKSLMMCHLVEARESIKQIIRDGSGRIVLDLSLVKFMDGSGLGLPVSMLQQARRRGGDVHLVMSNTHNSVTELFKLCRLNTVFRVFPDVAGAINAFSLDQNPSPPT